MKLKTGTSDNCEKPMNTSKFTENEELYDFAHCTDENPKHKYDMEYNSNEDTMEYYTDSQSFADSFLNGIDNDGDYGRQIHIIFFSLIGRMLIHIIFFSLIGRMLMTFFLTLIWCCTKYSH